VSPVKYELGVYIPEDGTLHSQSDLVYIIISLLHAARNTPLGQVAVMLAYTMFAEIPFAPSSDSGSVCRRSVMSLLQDWR
jgi:hypothetical protein